MDLADAVNATSVAADSLAEVRPEDGDVSTLRAGLRDLKLAQSRIDAQVARLTHAADAAGAFIGTGARDTAEWLAQQTGTSTRKNRTAAELGEAMSKSDELADAVASGDVSTDQASAAVGAADGRALDAEIIDEIADLSLGDVKPAVERWRNRHDPDGDADLAERQRAQRRLTLTKVTGGMTRLDGLLDPDSASIVRTTLDGIMSQSAFDRTNRTREQRCADALTQLCSAASKGKIPGGRSNTMLIAISPFETITERASARGHTHVGNTLDPDTVRRLACDAGIHRMITGPGSSILDFGHENRLVSENQFLALVTRDQHCRWPGCTIRATWCDAHHIVYHVDDGPTNDENLALFCHRHHQLSHQPGWRVTGTGAEIRVEHPDGSVEISRPPPQVAPPRAGTTGRDTPTADAPTPTDPATTADDPGPTVRAPTAPATYGGLPWDTRPEQLSLA